MFLFLFSFNAEDVVDYDDDEGNLDIFFTNLNFVSSQRGNQALCPSESCFLYLSVVESFTARMELVPLLKVHKVGAAP